MKATINLKKNIVNGGNLYFETPLNYGRSFTIRVADFGTHFKVERVHAQHGTVHTHTAPYLTQ